MKPISKPLPSKEELLARYKIACDLKQPVNHSIIKEKIGDWIARVSREKLRVRIVEDEASAKKYARAAWDARDAWDAWDARAAWDAWDARVARAAWDARDAWDAWAARVARDAWDARAARVARDAWFAWAARDAWAARAAWAASWTSIAAIGAVDSGDMDTAEKWMPIFEAFEAGAFCFWITKDEVIVTPIPQKVSVDARRLLHSEVGPAFAWMDVADFYWHGVYVPEYVVMRPEEITSDKIDAEPNAEVRRVMMERYGFGRYLETSGAKEIHRDDFGILYRKEIGNGDPIVCVKVVNSTPEPDGSYKDYWLRVAPDLRPLPPGEWSDEKKRSWFDSQKPQNMTAHAAVASTFGLRAEEYAPEIET